MENELVCTCRHSQWQSTAGLGVYIQHAVYMAAAEEGATPCALCAAAIKYCVCDTP